MIILPALSGRRGPCAARMGLPGLSAFQAF